MRLLEPFSVLLLDMNGTFMFGHDRFGKDQDYFSTYQSVGGRGLARERLLHMIHSTYDAMLLDYNTPDKFESFPSVQDGLREYGRAPEDDIPMLEKVFAHHELGTVPPTHADFLRNIAASHQLGVVSNLWSKPEPWLEVLRASGILPVFKTPAEAQLRNAIADLGLVRAGQILESVRATIRGR